METISKNTLKELAEKRGTPAISIYLPTHEGGHEVNEHYDEKLFKNQLKDIKHTLETERKMDSREVETLLKPAYELLNDVSFWRHQSHGLAVFVADGYFKYFKLPYEAKQQVTVTQGFHLSQLLPACNQEKPFFVLALSLKTFRLLTATKNSVQEIDLNAEIEGGIDTILNRYNFEEVLQHHSGQGGNNRAIFHGHGSGEQNMDAYQYKYFKEVLDAISSSIIAEQTPVVLAAVESIAAEFKKANQSLHICDQVVTGNPDDKSAEQLRDQAWKVIEPTTQQETETKITSYQELMAAGRSSAQLQDIALAAESGRIDTLFVAKDSEEKWGLIDLENQQVEIHNQPEWYDTGLMAHAAVATVLNGGRAYFMNADQMKEKQLHSDIAAVYRW